MKRLDAFREAANALYAVFLFIYEHEFEIVEGAKHLNPFVGFGQFSSGFLHGFLQTF